MSPASAFLLAIGLAIVAKLLAWLRQRSTGNAGIVDSVWSWTLGALALLFAALGDAPAALRLLLGLMGGIWGLRLGLHLWQRNRDREEDWRYAMFRQRWGGDAQRNFFWMFQFQNLFSLSLAACAFLPVAWRDDLPHAAPMAAAVLIWIAAIAGETLADRQMEAFRATHSGSNAVCRKGLWRYSRHPNYFFECLHWAAYVLLALGAPWGAVSLAAPVIMAMLLMKLSGVPLMEREMMRRKPAYADYVRTTSPLVPWPPRASAP